MDLFTQLKQKRIYWKDMGVEAWEVVGTMKTQEEIESTARVF